MQLCKQPMDQVPTRSLFGIDHGYTDVCLNSDRQQTRDDVIEGVQIEAERLGLSLTTRDSNNEGTILDLILNAQRPFILCWNGTTGQ